MSRGRRFNGERKLNMKKVAGLIIVVLTVILCIWGIKQILKADKQTMATKNVELHYYTLFANGNWGVINSSGETIIEPAYAEMIIIPNKTKPVFVCTQEVNYVEETYKSKVINDKNQELFVGYENVSVIQNYNENDELWFEENVLKVQKEGKYGLINLDGTETLPCEYDSITALKGIKNSLILKKEGKVGLANTDGTIIVPVEYSEVNAVTENYQNGYIVKNSENKYGIIKLDGQIALEAKYDNIKNIRDNDMYIVKIDGKWKVLANDGTIYLEGLVDNAVSMNNGYVVVAEKNKYGIINIYTEAKTPVEYEELTYMFEDKFIAKKDSKYGIININNEVMVELKYSNLEYNKTTDYIKAKKDDGTYDYMTRDFSVKLVAGEEKVLNGFISIQTAGETKYYNYKLEEKTNKEAFSTNTLFVSKQNGKYGFVNKEGKLIVEHVYEDALEQNEYGYCAIKKDGKWGAIDQYGNVIVEPKFTLNNNKVINFIGKWHVCADANANYYTDVE